MEERNPFEGIKTCGRLDLLWLYAGLVLLVEVLGFLGMGYLGKLLGVQFDSYESSVPGFLLAGGVSWYLLSGLGVAWRRAWADWQARAASDLKKAAKYTAGYAGILLAMGLVLAAAYYIWGDSFAALMKNVSASSDAQEQSAKAMSASGFRFFLLLVSACAVAPVVEEVFFRRIVFASLRARKSFWFSAFWAGLLFALFHGGAAPVTLPVGIYMCWVYERERRLPVNIMMHAAVNFLAILFKTFY
ncbi:MAG: type II CAAX endopeptidase family protein [Elusimicrobiales bacterium]|nr:type II CAAX endopeptidase family protein [Elusimicrobiales bacterium]